MTVFDDKENFEKVAWRFAEHIEDGELRSTARNLKLSLSLDEPLECFAVIAYIQTRELHKFGKKAFIRNDLCRKLREIEEKAGELGELINFLPRGVREWFGDESEKWGDVDNPAALKCFGLANTARFVATDLMAIGDGAYSAFLRSFLEKYFIALGYFRTDSKEDFENYLDAKFKTDRAKLANIFASVIAVGLSGKDFRQDTEFDTVKSRRKNFDNNYEPIVARFKRDALQRWRNN